MEVTEQTLQKSYNNIVKRKPPHKSTSHVQSPTIFFSLYITRCSGTAYQNFGCKTKTFKK